VSDRDAFREARDAGLKARHETREARAVRKAVAEEIALACEQECVLYAEAMDAGGERSYALAGTSIGLTKAAEIAREIGSRDPA